MEYNTTRSKLVISEYGRNIQKMIEYAVAVEDREKRTRIAKAIVHIMGQLNPHYNNGEHRQKLWDHLFIISDFKLDVDSPYPMPSPDSFNAKPNKVEYPSNHIKYKHYGKNIEKIIEKTIEMDEGDEKQELTKIVANHLKKSFLHWNRNSVNDEVIYEHLEELSNGKLKLSEDIKLNNTREILAKNNPPSHHKKKQMHSHSHNKNNNSNRGKRKNPRN